MEQKKLDRINELAAKAKTVGLTEEETAERQALRDEYRASIVGNLTMSLENCYVLDDNGNKVPVKKKTN